MYKIKQQTKKLTTVALMSAMVFVVTWMIRIPLPFLSGGYLNFGDVMIYICAYLLGGPQASIAAAVGSGLADLAAGAAVYILPTFIIKGIMGFLAGVISRKQNFRNYMISCVAGGAFMTAGYAVFEYLFFDAAYALAALPFNTMQWAASVIIAAVTYTLPFQLNVYFQSKYIKI